MVALPRVLLPCLHTLPVGLLAFPWFLLCRYGCHCLPRYTLPLVPVRPCAGCCGYTAVGLFTCPFVGLPLVRTLPRFTCLAVPTRVGLTRSRSGFATQRGSCIYTQLPLLVPRSGFTAATHARALLCRSTLVYNVRLQPLRGLPTVCRCHTFCPPLVCLASMTVGLATGYICACRLPFRGFCAHTFCMPRSHIYYCCARLVVPVVYAGLPRYIARSVLVRPRVHTFAVTGYWVRTALRCHSHGLPCICLHTVPLFPLPGSLRLLPRCTVTTHTALVPSPCPAPRPLTRCPLLHMVVVVVRLRARCAFIRVYTRSRSIWLLLRLRCGWLRLRLVGIYWLPFTVAARCRCYVCGCTPRGYLAATPHTRLLHRTRCSPLCRVARFADCTHGLRWVGYAFTAFGLRFGLVFPHAADAHTTRLPCRLRLPHTLYARLLVASGLYALRCVYPLLCHCFTRCAAFVTRVLPPRLPTPPGLVATLDYVAAQRVMRFRYGWLVGCHLPTHLRLSIRLTHVAVNTFTFGYLTPQFLRFPGYLGYVAVWFDVTVAGCAHGLCRTHNALRLRAVTHRFLDYGYYPYAG